jgi:hypothetical protein
MKRSHNDLNLGSSHSSWGFHEVLQRDSGFNL